MKTDYIHLRITEQEKADLDELIESIGDPEMSVSRFVRDAIREKSVRAKRRIERRHDAMEAKC